jgi:CBS-domain-containing membrane protein
MRKQKHQSSAEKTLAFIAEHPSVKECLRRGLINHTALAREICRVMRITSIDAVVMASTRYAARIKKQRRREVELKQMLTDAKILVNSKVLLAAWERQKDLSSLLILHDKIRKRGRDITIVEGHRLITIFTENEFADEIKRSIGRGLKLLMQDLVKITLLLPEKVTYTSGYAAYMFHLIAEKGVNLLGDVTSTAEHIFIIEEKDLPQALAALKVGQSE